MCLGIVSVVRLFSTQILCDNRSNITLFSNFFCCGDECSRQRGKKEIIHFCSWWEYFTFITKCCKWISHQRQPLLDKQSLHYFILTAKSGCFITVWVMRDNFPASAGGKSGATNHMHFLSAAITQSLLIFPIAFIHLHQVTRGPL